MSKQIHIHFHRATVRDSDKAYREGYAAYQKGKTPTNNPYKPGTDDFRDWLEGLDRAHQNRDSIKDSVASVEKEIAQQQRLIDAAKDAALRVVKTLEKQLELAQTGKLFYINSSYGYSKADVAYVKANPDKKYFG